MGGEAGLILIGNLHAQTELKLDPNSQTELNSAPQLVRQQEELSVEEISRGQSLVTSDL
jgi:hypothetical protein